jgi:hypothetical protein
MEVFPAGRFPSPFYFQYLDHGPAVFVFDEVLDFHVRRYGSAVGGFPHFFKHSGDMFIVAAPGIVFRIIWIMVCYYDLDRYVKGNNLAMQGNRIINPLKERQKEPIGTGRVHPGVERKSP